MSDAETRAREREGADKIRALRGRCRQGQHVWRELGHVVPISSPLQEALALGAERRLYEWGRRCFFCPTERWQIYRGEETAPGLPPELLLEWEA